jgi:tripartite-type tricarboxylate transporter receptor subunit TctC
MPALGQSPANSSTQGSAHPSVDRPRHERRRANMASAGNGSSSHMAGELFKMMAGVDMVHVPYRGQGPAMTDLLGGQLQVIFATTPGTGASRFGIRAPKMGCG